MTFPIYSIGDLNYLRAIFESVAALVGTGFPTQLAAIGFIISTMILSMQAVMNGGKMPQFQNLLVGWVIYAFMFGPGVTVQIHDAYSLNSVAVGNVPFGVAAVGSIMSRMGHEITEEMETAFSLPTMIGNGFGAPLERLLKARNLTLGPADTNIDGLNTTQHGSLMKTISTYVKDCTMAGIQLGTINDSYISKSPDPWTSMKFTSEVFGTRTYLPDPAKDPEEGTNRTCSDAHDAITSHIQSASFWNGYLKHLQTDLGADPVGTMQNSLDSLVGVGVNAKQYMLSAIFRDAYESGIQQSLIESGDVGGVIVTSTAREQRNIQWTAESSLFMTVVRPMLTFFEGFFYALTPFLAFLVVLVPMGLSLAGKYLILALWIQLWLPTMAILNYYINFVANGKLAALNTVNSITSFSGMEAGSSSLADWLATAGMLAASTPAITLVLVSGSAVAMANLSSRISGSDHINEKQLAPDAIDNNAIASLSSMKSWDLPGGSRTTGAERIAPTIDFGGGVSSSIQSSHAEAQSARQAFSSDWSQHVASNQGLQNQFSDVRGLGQTISSSKAQSAQTLREISGQIGSQFAQGSQQMETLQGILGAGLPAGDLTGVKAAIQNQFGETESNQLLKNLNRFTSSKEGQQATAQLTDQLASEIKKGEGSFYTDSIDTGTKEALGQSAEKATSAEDRYQQALGSEQHFGSNYSMNGLDMANQLVQGGHYNWMDSKIGAMSGDAQARVGNLTQRYMDSNGMGLPYQQARTLAGLTVMNDNARMKVGAEAQNAQNSLLDAAYKATGAEYLSPESQAQQPGGGMAGAPNQNQGIGAPAVAAGNEAKAEVETAQAGAQPLPSAADVQGQVKAGQEQIGGQVANGRGQVLGAHEQNLAEVKANAKTADAEQKAQMGAAIRNDLKEKMDNPSMTQISTEKAIAAAEAMRDMIAQTGAHIMAGADGFTEGFSTLKDKSLETLDKFINTMRENPEGGGVEGAWNDMKQELRETWGAFKQAAGVGDDGEYLNTLNEGLHRDDELAQTHQPNTLGDKVAATGEMAWGLVEALAYGREDALKGEREAQDLNYQVYRDSQFDLAKEHGLTDQQAEYYAQSRTDLAHRALSVFSMDKEGGLDFAEAMTKLYHPENDYGTGIDPNSIEARAIHKAAETGQEYYLNAVGTLNDLGGGGETLDTQPVTASPVLSSNAGNATVPPPPEAPTQPAPEPERVEVPVDNNAGQLPGFEVGDQTAGHFLDNRAPAAPKPQMSPELLDGQGGGAAEPKITVGPDGMPKKESTTSKKIKM